MQPLFGTLLALIALFYRITPQINTHRRFDEANKILPELIARMHLRPMIPKRGSMCKGDYEMKILAVDDDPTILDMLRACLPVQYDFDLVCAETAEQAVEYMMTEVVPFDCFLLDIMLPGINGIELCDHIRQLHEYRTTPVIMITASRQLNLMERAFHAGATDFIFKPLNGVELGARINTAGMLNDSLRREQVAKHSLTELTDLMKIRREESFDLGVEAVADLNGFENRLLRLPQGCYAMSLIAIKLPQVLNIFDQLTPAEFCRQMVRVAEASVQALHNERFLLGYAGNGTLVGAVLGRTRSDPATLQNDIEEILTQDWMVSKAGRDIGTDISVRCISNQRLWSGLSACNMIRDYLGRDAPPYDKNFEEREGLFKFSI